MEDIFEKRRKKFEFAEKRIFSYLIKAWSEIKIDFNDDKIKCERDLILAVYFHLRKMFQENKENYQIHSETKLQYDMFSNRNKTDTKFIDLVIEGYVGFEAESLEILYLIECKYFTLNNPFNSARWANDFLKWQKIASIQDTICQGFAHLIIYDYTPTNLSPLTAIFSSNPLFIEAFKICPDLLELGDFMTPRELRSQILTEWIRTHYAEFVGISDFSWNVFHNFSFVYGAIENNICPIEKDEIKI
jgi:hypothetical protein